MRQKLQIVGWMAALLLSAVLWTAPAMAEEVKYELWIAGKQLTSENCTNISKDNGFPGVTIAEGGKFSYDKANNKLLMKDVAVDSKELDAIKHQIVNLTIEVEGTNTFNAEGRAAGLRCLASTKLEGRGSLTITVKDLGIYFGQDNAELSISDITLNTSGRYGISGDVVLQHQKLTINNAIVIAKGELRAMDDWDELSLSNCAIVTPEVSNFESGSIFDIKADEWAKKVEIAPTYGLYIAGKQVHALNCDKINSKNFPGVTIADGGECRYDNEKRTLFMKNVTIKAGDGHSAVANGSIYNLRIKVEGKNYWNATDRSALYNGAEIMSIRGEDGKAQLEVTSRDSAAVCVKETVTVNYIDFTATGKWGVLGKDPTDQLCNFNLHFAKGTIIATGTEEDKCAVSNVYDMGYDDVLIREPIITSTNGGYKWPNKFFADQDGKKVKKITVDRKFALYIATGYVDVDNCNNIPADPQFKHITVAQGGHLYYKHDIRTLFMKDVTIEEPDRLPSAITNKAIEGLTIHLEGKNVWSVQQKGIVCQASTKITGNGTLTLTIKPKDYIQYGFGIQTNNNYSNITVDVSDITIEAHTPILLYSDPLHGTGKFILNNVKATVHGSLSNTDHTFKGCKIVSADGASPIEIDRIRVESVTFDPKEITRYVGDAPAAVPMPTIRPDEAGNKKLAWTSDNEEVAKVVDGKLIIGTKGTAILTAKATDGSNKEDKLTVHVYYRVDGVKLFQNDQEIAALTITEGQSVTLAAKVAPDGVPNGVEWVSEASEFTVTDKTAEKATFTALKAGDYTITARAAEDTEKTATVNVKVLPKVASLVFYEKGKTEAIGKTVTFEVGESKTFEVKQLPAEALTLPVTWSAAVNGQPAEGVTVENGVVKVTKWVEGCEITAQVKVSDSETVKNSFTVVVLKPAPKEIKLAPKEFTIKSGESQEVNISFVGDEPFDERVTVTPQDSEHFTVAHEGKKLTITGKKPTTAAVTLTVASTKDPNIKESCQVTVTKKAPTKIIIPESFSLAIEETKEMTVTFEGGDYIDKELDIEPKTNENIEIKQEGDKLMIKGTKLTTDPVTVTVKSKNFAAVPEATCQVTVTKKVPTAITIAQADKAFELTKEQTKVITLTFTPAEYVDQEVEVTVNPKDALTATAVDGKLTIKADKPFDKETTVEVTVTSKVTPTVSDNCKVTLKYEAPEAVEDAALARIAVAPNPFSTELRIENPEGIEGYYELLTAAGVAVRSGALDAHKVIVNTEALPAGVYFLHIRQGELLNTHKTVKVVKY